MRRPQRCEGLGVQYGAHGRDHRARRRPARAISARAISAAARAIAGCRRPCREVGTEGGRGSGGAASQPEQRTGRQRAWGQRAEAAGRSGAIIGVASATAHAPAAQTLRRQWQYAMGRMMAAASLGSARYDFDSVVCEWDSMSTGSSQ